MSNKPLTDYINLGPTIVKNLHSVGVYSLLDIQKVGPAGVYLRLVKKYPKKVFPVCYYLYSLEGALTNTYWDVIPEKTKAQLLQKIGK